MTCPECQSSDVDEAGTCRACGFRAGEAIAGEPARRSDPKSYPGAFEVDFSERSEAGLQDLPEWRKELSRRLQEIRQKRLEHPSETARSMAAPAGPGDQDVPARETRPATSASAPPPVISETESAARTAKPPKRTVPPSRRPAPRVSKPATEVPDSRHQTMPLFRKPAEASRPTPGPEGVRDMIDQAIGRHHEKGGPAAADQLPDAATLAAGPATISVHPPVARDGPDRLILLTRTLSGLVDLIIVAACTLGVIAATDFVTGIGEVDLRSALVYAALLVLVFLLYSVFFMGTANQTIGMMITDLRVLSDEGTRPAFRKVLGRSVAYMLSLAPAGIGLLWGCFDRDCRCWHDRMSGTRVGRVL